MSEARPFQSQNLKSACSNCSVLELCLPLGLTGPEIERLDTLIVQRFKVKKGAALYHNPNAEIIFDVKCTRRLTPLIKEYGGRPLMWKTGHSLIKKKMKETGALLAGEMSGHVFFKERWFGFDDGIYSAARLLEILSKEKSTAEELFQTFPNDISTPEINIHVTEESKFSIIDALHDAQWGEGANLTTIDGVRVDYAKGWGLVRASNTTPVLVLRFEADTEAELQRIKDVFHAQLKRVAPDLQLPF